MADRPEPVGRHRRRSVGQEVSGLGRSLEAAGSSHCDALEAHTAARADYETEKVVFDANKDAIEGRIKEAAKKPSKGDPASIAKELRTHGEQAPGCPDASPL